MDIVWLLLTMIIIVTYIGMGALSFINGGLSKKTIIYTLMMIAGAVWTISVHTMTTTEPDNILISVPINWVCIVIIYAMMLLFSLTFLHIEKKAWYRLVAVILVALVTQILIQLLLPDGKRFVYIEGADGVWSYYAIILSPMTVLLILYIVAHAATSIVVLARARKQAETELGRKLISGVLIGSCVLVALNFIFNLIITDLDLHRIDTLFVVLTAMPFYRAVIKHGDDDL